MILLYHWNSWKNHYVQKQNFLHKYSTCSERTFFLGIRNSYNQKNRWPQKQVKISVFYDIIVMTWFQDKFPVSDKVALQLAGLQAQVVCGEYEEGKDNRWDYLSIKPGNGWCACGDKKYRVILPIFKSSYTT